MWLCHFIDGLRKASHAAFLWVVKWRWSTMLWYAECTVWGCRLDSITSVCHQHWSTSTTLYHRTHSLLETLDSIFYVHTLIIQWSSQFLILISLFACLSVSLSLLFPPIFSISNKQPTIHEKLKLPLASLIRNLPLTSHYCKKMIS